MTGGIEALGRTSGLYRNPLNADHDEGTYWAVRVLQLAVTESAHADSYPAAQQATEAIKEVALACVTARKNVTLQAPLQSLVEIGIANAEEAIDVASRATIGLVETTILLCASDQRDVMVRSNAETAVRGIRDITMKAGGALGPGHFLVAPLTKSNLPVLVQRLEEAASRTREMRQDSPFDYMASSMADLSVDLQVHPTAGYMVRPNAIDATGCIIVGLLMVPAREPVFRVIHRLTNWLLSLSLRDASLERHATPALAWTLLAAYYRSRQWPEAETFLRALIIDVLKTSEGAEDDGRRRMSPGLRQIGAAAMHFNDNEIATGVARATLPLEKGGPDEFQDLGAFAIDYFDLSFSPLQRPGLMVPTLGDYHLDEVCRRHYLELEALVHSPDEKPPHDDETAQ